MKTSKEQGVNTPKEQDYKVMNSKGSEKNVLSDGKQGVVNQWSMKTIIKVKQPKPFSSFVVSKYQQMDQREFKKIPISFIKQIYEKNQIDLRKVNQEGNLSKFSSTQNYFNTSKLYHNQQNLSKQDNKTYNNGQIYYSQQNVQMSKSQIQFSNQKNYQINQGMNQSDDQLNLEFYSQGMNDSNSFSSSPLSVRSCDNTSRSLNNNHNLKFIDQVDIIKEDNNSEVPSSSNLLEKKIKSQQSNHNFKDNTSHWRMKDLITSPTQVYKMINQQSLKNEFQESKQISNTNEQSLPTSQKQSLSKQINFPTLKGQEPQQLEIFSKTESDEFYFPQTKKGRSYTQLSQLSINKRYSDQEQNNVKEQNAFPSNQYSQMNSMDKKQINMLYKAQATMKGRTKTEGNEDSYIIGMIGRQQRTHSNSIREDDSNSLSQHSISKTYFTNELNSKNRILSKRQNSSQNIQQGVNSSLKYSANLRRLNSEIEDDYFIKNKLNTTAQDKLSIQFLTKNPFATQEGENIKSFSSTNRTHSQNDTEFSNLTFNKKTSSAVQNFKKLNTSQNSFKFRVDEQKEKIKNDHLKTQQEKKQNNKNLFVRKSFRVSDIGQPPILEINDLNINKTPLLLSGIVTPKDIQNPNQKEQSFPDFELIQNNQQTADRDSQDKSLKDQLNNKQQKDQTDVNKDLKILESKFVVHKPQNHNKNREYIKSLQSQKNNVLNSPINIDQCSSPKQNKKRFSLLSPALSFNDYFKKDKDQDFTNQMLNSPSATSKNKSQFSKHQLGNGQNLDLDFEFKGKTRNKSQTLTNNDKDNILNIQKNKNESDEFKTQLVRSLLQQQTIMYEEYQSSLEHKLFQKKKQENQINLKNNNNLISQAQNELNASMNNKNTQISYVQENQSPTSQIKQNNFGQFSVKNHNKGTTIAEKLQQEEKLMIRRSSLRLNVPHSSNEQSPLLIPGLSEVLNKNNQINTTNRQAGQYNLSADSPLGKKSQIPTIEISISNKDQNIIPQNVQKRNSKLLTEQPIPQKRNSRILNNQNAHENITNDDNNLNTSNPLNCTQKQQTSIFSKMFSQQANEIERRISKIGENDPQNISQKSWRNNKMQKKDSSSSQSSSDSDSSDSSRKSSNSNERNNTRNSKKNQLILQINKIVSPLKAISNFSFEFAAMKAENEILNSQSSQSSQKSPLKAGQIFGFSESIKSFYDNQTEGQSKNQKDTTPRNSNSLQQKQSFSGAIPNQGMSPRSSGFNQSHELGRSGSFMKISGFDQRKSVNSPLNSPRNQNIRPSINDSDQSQKQKGFATIQIELKEIMDQHILKNIEQSQKIIDLLNQHDTNIEDLKKYYKLFLEITLLEENKVFNIDIFAPFKMHNIIFEELQNVFIETLKSLNYNTRAIEEIIENLEKQKKIISQGQLFNEIGGSSGIHKLIIECLDQINQKMPSSFTKNLSTEQKTSILTRLITIICNYERQYSPNANYFTNSMDQKGSYNTEISPLLHSFKDFGQLEFYCLKITFWSSLKQRKYRTSTIFRFLEQFEKTRYKIQQSITTQNLLSDKQLYEQIIQDYIWKIQCDYSLTQIFENNNELITHFCHANVLEFIYNIQGRFDLLFLLSKLTQIQHVTIKKLENLLIDVIQTRGLSAHLITDVQIKFIKLSYKLKLIESPLSHLNSQEEFLESLINEIDSIMRSDKCFEEFIKKFPEDKQSLTLGEKSQNLQTKSGLHALSFFLVTLLSDYDVYRIQDLHSLLQAYNISITIPIQWKIAIELSLNNLKVPSVFANRIIDIVSEQFSQLYKNTQYESFNKTLLN